MTAASSVDWPRIARDFPVNDTFIWLNNCGVAPPPRPVVERVASWLHDYAARGVLASPSEWEVHASVCGRLARLLNVDADELALVHNTNEGMTFVSHGLDLSPGDRVLLLENEYPSNVYPWEHWRARGVALDTVAVGSTPEELLVRLQSALHPRTRVVSLSAVHWCTGMPLPIAEVGLLCEGRGIDLVLDAAQGAGLVPLDLRAQRVAYAAFSAWKWLLGPLGLGVLYVRRDKLARLRFPFKGTGSVVDDAVYLPHRDTLKPTTARYVLSTPNFNDWIFFDASLAYLEALGFPAVRARILELAARLADGLRSRGFSLLSDAFPTHPTGILAVEHNGFDAAHLAAELERANIVAAVRLGRLRLAPHVYLSESQIDHVSATLGGLCGG